MSDSAQTNSVILVGSTVEILISVFTIDIKARQYVWHTEMTILNYHTLVHL